MVPSRKSPPAEFDKYISSQCDRTDLARSQLSEDIAREILAETRRNDGTLWVSFVDTFAAAIRRVIEKRSDRDKILEEVLVRLEDAKRAE